MTLARSTRGLGPVPFLEAVDRGLAPDGGLYLPEPWPRLSDPPPGLGSTLADTAAWAAPLLLRRVLHGRGGEDRMAELARAALDFPAPLVPSGPGVDLLELFHGPTLAFKDVGARFLARLWSASAGDTSRTVLVATSGDTGGAVAQACHGVPGLRVVVLYPAGRVSRVQRHQFTTLGGNVLAVEVEGPFDHCQALAREMLGDAALARRLGLTSANSINLGRLLPQVFYYLHLARCRGWGRGAVERRPVIVPSGNLGNITAGLLARRAGAPLGTLVAACNANDALVRYETDGETRAVPVRRTLSTAMDVGAPSNLERLAALTGNDARSLAREVPAEAVEDGEVRETLRRTWSDHRVLVDPHTAVGLAVAARDRWRDTGPTVLATAHPAKFPDVVEGITGTGVPAVPRLARQLLQPERAVRLVDGRDQLVRVVERTVADGAMA